MISPSLRHLISQHLFLSAIKDIAVFSKMPEVIEFLVLNLEGHQYMPEDFIIKQGHKATHLYILAHG